MITQSIYKEKKSSERGKRYLDRLKAAKGRRVLIDLNEAGNKALENLLSIGYGVSNKEVVIKALMDADKEKIV